MVRMTSVGALRAEAIVPILASGENLTSLGVDNKPRKFATQQWQKTVWRYYDIVPAFHYGVDYVGNLISRAKLVVLEDGKPTKNQNALNALASFYGGEDQQGEFFRQAGIHMSTPGEFYVVEINLEGEDIWQVVSATEIKKDVGGWKITDIEATPSFVLRAWRPHPVKPQLADSPARALMSTLATLDACEQYTHAQLSSRLTGNGMLLFPKETDFPSVVVTKPDGTTETIAGNPDSFVKYLFEVASTAKKNPESAAARIPIILQTEGEFIDKIKHITFWSELDEHLPKIREDAQATLGTGMDVPPEVLTGTADMNHWGAWQMEEAAIKAHTEPLLALIVRALTTGYLRPVLQSKLFGTMSTEEAERFSFGVDTTEMRLRPNRSKEAFELYDRGELSAAALLREAGFEVSDAISPAELKLWLARKLALGAASATPDQLAAMAKVLGNLDLPGDTTDDEKGPREATPSLQEHPRRNPPEITAAAGGSGALLAASEVLVFRALERAGNRLKTRFRDRPEGVAAKDLYLAVPLTKDDIDFAIDGCLDGIAAYTTSLPVDANQLREALTTYVSMLMNKRAEHDPKMLQRHLAAVEEA